MPLNDADQEQSQLVNELKLGKVQKRNISNKKSRENAKKNNPNVFNTPKWTKERCRKIPFKLHENFTNKIINDENNINNKILTEYFGYEN